MKKCLVCSKEVSSHSKYCCREHWYIDTHRYTDESIKVALKRRSIFLKKKQNKLKNDVANKKVV